MSENNPGVDRGQVFAGRAAEILSPIPALDPPKRPASVLWDTPEPPTPIPPPGPPEPPTPIPPPDVPSGGYPDVGIRLREEFKSYVREFMDALRAFCVNSTTNQDEYISRGERYRWKFLQGETPRKGIVDVFKVSKDGDLVKSDTVRINLAGNMFQAPVPLRDLGDTLYEERERRKAAAAPALATPQPAPPSPPLFNRAQLQHIAECLNIYIKIRHMCGVNPNHPEIVMSLTCIDVIDRDLDGVKPDSTGPRR
jgi:hypothetical protein